MKKILLPVLLSIFVAYGCQKEFVFTDGTEPTTGGGNNTNPGTCNAYFPTTLGTYWTYYNEQGIDNTITIVNQDTLVNGKTFKKFKSSVYADGFVREENGNVYQYANTGAAGTIMMNILRANNAIGEKWRDTSVLNGIPEIFEYEILEKNVNLKVDNLNFSNVIHARYKVTIDFPPYYNNEEIQTTEMWFGKCIGPLQTKTVTTFMGIASDTLFTKIKSYQIK